MVLPVGSACCDLACRAARQLEALELRFSADSEDARVRDECCPGQPYAVFRRAPAVPVTLVNPQPSSGLFQLRLPVRQGDTPRTLAARLARQERAVRGGSHAVARGG